MIFIEYVYLKLWGDVEGAGGPPGVVEGGAGGRVVVQAVQAPTLQQLNLQLKVSGNMKNWLYFWLQI